MNYGVASYAEKHACGQTVAEFMFPHHLSMRPNVSFTTVPTGPKISFVAITIPLQYTFLPSTYRHGNATSRECWINDKTQRAPFHLAAHQNLERLWKVRGVTTQTLLLTHKHTHEGDNTTSPDPLSENNNQEAAILPS